MQTKKAKGLIIDAMLNGEMGYYLKDKDLDLIASRYLNRADENDARAHGEDELFNQIKNSVRSFTCSTLFINPLPLNPNLRIT